MSCFMYSYSGTVCTVYIYGHHKNYVCTSTDTNHASNTVHRKYLANQMQVKDIIEENLVNKLQSVHMAFSKYLWILVRNILMNRMAHDLPYSQFFPYQNFFVYGTVRIIYIMRTKVMRIWSWYGDLPL